MEQYYTGGRSAVNEKDHGERHPGAEGAYGVNTYTRIGRITTGIPSL
jgi:hypothetical protein